MRSPRLACVLLSILIANLVCKLFACRFLVGCTATMLGWHCQRLACSLNLEFGTAVCLHSIAYYKCCGAVLWALCTQLRQTVGASRSKPVMYGFKMQLMQVPTCGVLGLKPKQQWLQPMGCAVFVASCMMLQQLVLYAVDIAADRECKAPASP